MHSRAKQRKSIDTIYIISIWQNEIFKPLKYPRKTTRLHVNHSACWQGPIFVVKFQSLSLLWCHLRNSAKKKEIQLTQINVMFVHWLKWLTFTEKMRPIQWGPEFALSVLSYAESRIKFSFFMPLSSLPVIKSVHLLFIKVQVTPRDLEGEVNWAKASIILQLAIFYEQIVIYKNKLLSRTTVKFITVVSIAEENRLTSCTDVWTHI